MFSGFIKCSGQRPVRPGKRTETLPGGTYRSGIKVIISMEGRKYTYSFESLNESLRLPGDSPEKMFLSIFRG
jgi:hypothetical protein